MTKHPAGAPFTARDADTARPEGRACDVED